MFEERAIEAGPAGDELAAVRDQHAPGAVVLDCARDFELLDPAAAEDLGLLVDGLDPHDYDPAWVPADAPELLERYAGDEFTIGMPGDGGVVWSHQTDPPVVLVKPRLEGSPEAFVDFLLAEAFVELGLDAPEHFLGFFGERYPDFSAAVPFDGTDTYQLAAALYTAYLGLQTREAFADWDGDHPTLYDAWVDAGGRLQPRLADLSTAVARGDTSFPVAAELACSAIKHVGVPDSPEIPPPFAALDTAAYLDHGPTYAIEWARKTVDSLAD